MENKIDRPVFPIDLEIHNYVLVRVDDDKQMPCTQIKFVEWTENGTFKAVHDEPAVGRSIIADPQWMTYTWLTTTITEIISDNEFKTKNSTYKLYTL